MLHNKVPSQNTIIWYISANKKRTMIVTVCLVREKFTLVDTVPAIFKSPPVIEVQRCDCDLSVIDRSQGQIYYELYH
jgi:hypothetical protein